MNTLKNKNILITGASRGLGAVCAQAFSALGANLVLTARSAEKLEEVRNGCVDSDKHLVLPKDLTKSESVADMIAATTAFFDKPDAVLHVAGGGLGLKDDLLDVDSFHRLLSLNLGVAIEINRLVAPQMIKNGKGNLVHVGALAGTEAVGSVGYNTVKAALAGYVRSLGIKLAGTGVVVTGINPGSFWAPGNSWKRLKSRNPGVIDKIIAERLPRKRFADAGELTSLLAFLCSENASMMGGCMVPIDAGEGRGYV